MGGAGTGVSCFLTPSKINVFNINQCRSVFASKCYKAFVTSMVNVLIVNDYGSDVFAKDLHRALVLFLYRTSLCLR